MPNCPVEQDIRRYHDRQEQIDEVNEAAEDSAISWYKSLLADTAEVVKKSFVLEGLSEDEGCLFGLNALLLSCESGATAERIVELAHQIARNNKEYFVSGEVECLLH